MSVAKDKAKKEEVKEVGRPSLFKPEYCEQLIEHMAKGFSFRSFAALVRVNFDTVYEWEKVHKEFSDAKKIGEPLLLLYDEKLMDELTKGYHGKSASSASHIFKLKNLHGYKDKIETENTNKNIQVNITPEDEGL